MRIVESLSGIEVFGTTGSWGGEERRIMLMYPVFGKGWVQEVLQDFPKDVESAAEMLGALNAGHGYLHTYLRNKEDR